MLHRYFCNANHDHHQDFNDLDRDTSVDNYEEDDDDDDDEESNI